MSTSEPVASCNPKSRLYFSPDRTPLDQLRNTLPAFVHLTKGVKIHTLWDRYGMAVVRELKDAGATEVWVDTKAHDTVETVKMRADIVAESGADILTVHASGGPEMVAAAKSSGLKIYVVTALTSLSDELIARIYAGEPPEVIARLSSLALETEAREKVTELKQAGIDGFICSGRDVQFIANDKRFDGLDLVIPATRLPDAPPDKQNRTVTPDVAIGSGASFLVVSDRRDPISTMGTYTRLIAEAAPFPRDRSVRSAS